MSPSPPDLQIEPKPKSLRDMVSVIWLVPMVALVVALGVGLQTYLDRGPVIEILFENASGVTAGKTELRYRDVTVGVVEDIGFTDTLDKVVLGVRIDKDVKDYVDAKSEFWIVRPEVTTSGISGLDTVLSGVYIAGSWDNTPGGFVNNFDGRSDSPIAEPTEDIVRISLRTVGDGGLRENTPIVYKGIEVGRVGRARIEPDGSAVVASAFISAPHDRLITSSTRFWDSSGFSFRLGPSGAEIDFNSVASLVSGGITFETVVSGGDPLKEGDEFEVHPDEDAARNSVFAGSDGETLSLSVVFEENVSGLEPGSDVELNGLKIGTVSNLNGLVSQDMFGDRRVRLLTMLSIQPSRLGLPGETTPDQALAFLSDRVRAGLRARLASAGLLSGGLKVELVMVEEPSDALLDLEFEPYPRIPVTENKIADVSANAEGVFKRINDLPVEEVLEGVITFLDSANAVVNSESLRAAPDEFRALLQDTRSIVGSDSVQAMPERLNAAITEIEKLIAELNKEGSVERLLKAVDAAAQAGADVSASVEGIPALIEEIQAVATRAKTLPVEELIDELTALVDTAEGVLATDAAKALPGSLNSALAEIEATLAELREGGVIDNVNSALGSARTAADSVSKASAQLPEIVERMEKVLKQASATLADYDGSSELNRSARAALADISKAAKALGSLARTIERQPNSLLIGR